ncbi:Hypothetical protein PHPALM_14700 [Phytophthora palmivora]|uniref:Uncharacterized protein n=1 Tax=Phytophthora palmivora TaxID=4796 RepID=A0A2P4XU01_9STRA|nr:Hypothetical protein PHPALM_14700 [Phytophthora palmivora]
MSLGTTRERDDAISQYAQRSEPSTPNTQRHGTIMTDGGPIDANLAEHCSFSDDPENEDETLSNAPNEGQCPSNGAQMSGGLLPENYWSSATANNTATTTATGGPTLQRDPSRAAADARELLTNHNLSVASNRLGGQDLRVFRDNFDTMTHSILNENGKRATNYGTDGSSSNASYTKNKRVKAKQRMNAMQREIEEAERKQLSSGNEMMRMLLVLQKESDRRAEADERRRREDREERMEIEKRERAERDQIRREEAESAEKRRLEERLAAREEREEQRRIDAERETRIEREKEESNRRFEERLALERAEARQRHEQMMMVLTNLQKQ